MRRNVVLCALSVSLAAAAFAQTPAGGEFGINAYTTGDQAVPFAGIRPNGDFIVVWTSSAEDGDSLGAFGRQFAAPGVPRGSEFQLNAYTTGPQALPSIAVGSRGNFVVVWASIQDGPGYSIQGRRYDASGSAIGGEFLVNSATPGYMCRPQVGLASDGSFVVSWSAAEGNYFGIAARRFDASGNPIGSEFVVNTYTTGFQYAGGVGVQSNGSFVVVWEDLYNYRDDSGSSILGQLFDAAGMPVGGEFVVNTYTTGHQMDPSVSVSPLGGFVVAWTSPYRYQYGYERQWNVMARRFDASGNGLGDDFVVNTYTTGDQRGSFGQVAHDARGNFVVTWWGLGEGDDYGSFAQRFSASGARRGAEFQVNTYTTGLQLLSTVASDSVGNFVVVWDNRYGQDGSGYGLFAQRFGGLLPAELHVNTTGNLVWEPGESVDVRPTWRNVNGAVQTFAASLANLAGPVGATYTLTDAVGNYGTVPNDTNGPCTDCYTVAVDNPTPRPVQHWDATAVESITPDAQGQQKEWRLHIGGSFTDVPNTNGFYRFIETLLHHGITGGCGGTSYCPTQATTRDQMAVFVLVAKEGAGYAPPACSPPNDFLDVPATNPFCRFIEELARRGVVTGCGGGNYCPTQPVTREQMAVFVLRTLDPALSPPDCVPPNLYADVPETSPFCRWIEELTNRNVVTGCGGGNYCPTNPVTREQMGVFISATFGLTLYGP
jgi:hypothetical protein